MQRIVLRVATTTKYSTSLGTVLRLAGSQVRNRAAECDPRCPAEVDLE